jgi:hypothetical protein
MKRLLAVATILVVAGLAAPAAAVTATGTLTATIIRPISVTKGSDLAFGKIVKPSSSSSTVTLTPAGALTVTGSDGAAVTGSAHSAASFTVGGEGAQSFMLVIPGSVTLNGPSSSHITIATSNDAGCTTGCTLGGTLGGAAPAFVFHVGGSFTLLSTQTSGAYTNTTDLTVTATYN